MELNPSLVICSPPSYGTGGARAGGVGHDLDFVGLSGLLDELAADGVPRVQLAVARGVPLTAVHRAGEGGEDPYYRHNAPTRRALLPGGRDPVALGGVAPLGADTARVLSEFGHASPSPA